VSVVFFLGLWLAARGLGVWLIACVGGGVLFVLCEVVFVGLLGLFFLGWWFCLFYFCLWFCGAVKRWFVWGVVGGVGVVVGV